MSVIQKRKKSHIEIALKQTVTNLRKTTGFEDVELEYCALPELNADRIDTATKFLSKRISAPIMIDAITGGIEEGTKINKKIAAVAEAEQIPFSLGSQRAMIENRKLKDTYYVRDVAPSIPIIGNIGAVQLKEPGMVRRIGEALKDIDADALAIHLNPLQEVVQPEGDKNFVGCLAAIGEACDTLDVPVIVKEVGAGISGEVARKLDAAGVDMINIAGAGGTSWSRLELLRGDGRLMGFADGGIPTVCALIDARAVTKLPLIVSGGVRSGVDVAKGIALGADYGAAALPFLQAFANKKLENTVKLWKDEFRIAMFLAGAANLNQLKKTRVFVVGKTGEYLNAWRKAR